MRKPMPKPAAFSLPSTVARWAFSLFSLWLTASNFVSAETPQDLINQGLLRVETSFSIDAEAIPSQRVRLYIDVATARWFTGGTKIRVPEVPGLVILQLQDFATNSTVRVNGGTWTQQRWALEIFATHPGVFDIPPIALDVSVSVTPAEQAIGAVYTDSRQLTVSLPEALKEISDFVASPKLTVRTQVSGLDDEQTIAIGGAITRRITIEATDTMAMMLPELDKGGLPNLQAYSEPPLLRNRSNRGQLIATRTERFTYIATEPGDGVLPETEIWWWNTEENSLEKAVVPSLSFTVVGTIATSTGDRGSISQWLDRHWRRIQYVLGFTIVLIALWRWHHRVGKFAVTSLKAIRKLWLRLTSPALKDRLNPGGTSNQSWNQ